MNFEIKKRTAIIGTLLSLLPFGKPLVIGTDVALTSMAVMLSVPQRANAKIAYSKAIELDPMYESAYFNRGLAKRNLKDNYGAISDYTKAIEINPKDALAFVNRGNSKESIKDYYGAIADYTKAIEINPKDALAFSNRGITKEKIGDLKGACADWRKALQLGFQDAAKWVRDQC